MSSESEIGSSLYSCRHLFPDCFFDGDKECANWKRVSALTTSTVGLLGRLYLKLFHRVKVHNAHHLYDALDSKKTVITVANHYSCGDEPLLWGATLSAGRLCDNNRMRWSLAAHDICFTKRLHSNFFAFGKSIPVIRGGGVHQEGMSFALARLNEGNWLHVFPEGRVNMQQKEMRFKWGIGRLMLEAEPSTPLVLLPIFHLGMDTVWPREAPYLPSIRPKELTVNIGNPIDLNPIVKKLRADKTLSDEDRRKFITDFIQKRLWELEIDTLILHMRNKADYVY